MMKKRVKKNNMSSSVKISYRSLRKWD